MALKKTIGDKAFDTINACFLIFLMFITVYPFLYVVFASLSRPYLLMANTGLLTRPLGFSLKAYDAVFKNPNIYMGYKNTLFYVTVGTAINLFMTSLGAYVLSRKKFFWKNYIMIMVAFTMFFSGGLIPTYLLVRKLGMINSVWALVIPNAISTWNLIIMRTSFASIPDSLEESAKIDGATDMTILLRVIIPLSLPVISVMILWYGVAHWNSWFNAMIYLRRREMFPLQLVLRDILLQHMTEDMIGSDVGVADREGLSQTLKYATIMVATVPILLAYPFLQKYFVKGVMIGALKG